MIRRRGKQMTSLRVSSVYRGVNFHTLASRHYNESRKVPTKTPWPNDNKDVFDTRFSNYLTKEKGTTFQQSIHLGIKSYDNNLKDRISYIFSLFHTDPSLPRLSLKLFDRYNEADYNLIDDLVKAKNIRQGNYQLPSDDSGNLANAYESVLGTIFSRYKESKSLRALVTDQLVVNILNGNHESSILALELMINLRLVGNSESLLLLVSETKSLIADAKQSPSTSSPQVVSGLLNLLIRFTLASGDPIVAALIAIRCSAHLVDTEDGTIKQIILALSVPSPLMENYNMALISVLMEKFSQIEHDIAYRLSLIQNMLGQSLYYSNLHFDQIIKSHGPHLPPSSASILADMMVANMEDGNSFRALHMWKIGNRISDSFARKNVPTLRLIIDNISDLQASDLLQNHIPEDLLRTPELTDILLAFYGQRKETLPQFQELTRLLTPPLLRNTVSLLFVSFLFQNQESAADRLLQSIFSTTAGLNSLELDMITKKVLRQDEIGQAISLVKNANSNISKRAQVRIVDYFLSHETPSKSCEMSSEMYLEFRAEFFRQFCQNFSSLDSKDPILQDFTAVLLSHFSKRISNGASRKLFSTVILGKRRRFDFCSYNLPKEFLRLLSIGSRNRLKCLNIILDQAKRESDGFMVEWCIGEFRAHGITCADIQHFIEQ